MIYVTFDTNIWIYALDNSWTIENELIDYFQYWIEVKQVKLLLPEIILDEWERNKSRNSETRKKKLTEFQKLAVEILPSTFINTYLSDEIQDNGAGIEEEIRYKVFIPNFSTKYTGSGIGLALAKRGITNSGGKIWFETEMNIGTSFFIELPLLEYVD